MLKGPSRSKNRQVGAIETSLSFSRPAGRRDGRDHPDRSPSSLCWTAAASPASFAANCGTKPVTMQGYFETGFPDIVDLTQLFTKQYPNVKWNIREDPFATITSNAPLILSGPNPPDLMRMPQITGLVKDHLLKNMDGYFKTFGWDKFPASDLEQMQGGTQRQPPGRRPAVGAWASTTA